MAVYGLDESPRRSFVRAGLVPGRSLLLAFPGTDDLALGQILALIFAPSFSVNSESGSRATRSPLWIPCLTSTSLSLDAPRVTSRHSNAPSGFLTATWSFPS